MERQIVCVVIEVSQHAGGGMWGVCVVSQDACACTMKHYVLVHTHMTSLPQRTGCEPLLEIPE